jgi:hypothetical protein
VVKKYIDVDSNGSPCGFDSSKSGFGGSKSGFGSSEGEFGGFGGPEDEFGGFGGSKDTKDGDVGDFNGLGASKGSIYLTTAVHYETAVQVQTIADFLAEKFNEKLMFLKVLQFFFQKINKNI